MPSIRTAVKSIIVRDGHVLLTKNENRHGIYFLFPGGGQEHGEDLVTALKRECQEEIGARVEVGRLIFVRDYIARNHEFAADNTEAHQLELYFESRLLPGEVPTNGAGRDCNQIDVEWVSLTALPQIPLYPKVLKEGWSHLVGQYLGDVN